MKRLMIEDMYYNGDEKIFDVIKNSSYDEIFSIMQELEKENVYKYYNLIMFLESQLEYTMETL